MLSLFLSTGGIGLPVDSWIGRPDFVVIKVKAVNTYMLFLLML
jgi:hypothetical protein